MLQPRENYKTEAEYLAALRDWFAGQALAGLLASPLTSDDSNAVIRACYAAADAMLEARK